MFHQLLDWHSTRTAGKAEENIPRENAFLSTFFLTKWNEKKTQNADDETKRMRSTSCSTNESKKIINSRIFTPWITRCASTSHSPFSTSHYRLKKRHKKKEEGNKKDYASSLNLVVQCVIVILKISLESSLFFWCVEVKNSIRVERTWGWLMSSLETCSISIEIILN